MMIFIVEIVHVWLLCCFHILRAIIFPVCGCRNTRGKNMFAFILLSIFLQVNWKHVWFFFRHNYRSMLFDLFQNDGSSEILYNTKWYGLPIELQKDLMHLINRRQNRTALAIGPFTELNIETFFAVRNGIHFSTTYIFNLTH